MSGAIWKNATPKGNTKTKRAVAIFQIAPPLSGFSVAVGLTLAVSRRAYE